MNNGRTNDNKNKLKMDMKDKKESLLGVWWEGTICF